MSETKTVKELVRENMDKIITESLSLPQGWEAEAYIVDGELKFGSPLSPSSCSIEQTGVIGRIEAMEPDDYFSVLDYESAREYGERVYQDEEGDVRVTETREKATPEYVAELVDVGVEDMVDWGWFTRRALDTPVQDAEYTDFTEFEEV